MKIASYNTFATDLRSRGFEYALAHTEELGFDGVEALYLNQGLPSIDDVKRAKERFDAYGLEVVCYSVGVNLTPDKALLTEKELIHHANVAAALGSPFLHHTLATALRKTPELPTYEDIFDCVLYTDAKVESCLHELFVIAAYAASVIELVEKCRQIDRITSYFCGVIIPCRNNYLVCKTCQMAD